MFLKCQPVALSTIHIDLSGAELLPHLTERYLKQIIFQEIFLIILTEIMLGDTIIDSKLEQPYKS